MHKSIKLPSNKELIVSINKSNLPGWFIFIFGIYDSLGIKTQHFGGIKSGFAFVFEFFLPVPQFKLFGKNETAIKQFKDLETDIMEQAEILAKQVKEQEAKRAILRAKRKR